MRLVSTLSTGQNLRLGQVQGLGVWRVGHTLCSSSLHNSALKFDHATPDHMHTDSKHHVKGLSLGREVTSRRTKGSHCPVSSYSHVKVSFRGAWETQMFPDRA